MTNTIIQLTEQGILAAKELQGGNPEWAHQSLRLYLEGKGCDGFYYGVTFDKPEEDDVHFEQGGIDLIVDPETLKYCVGSKIDWVDDERGKGFLVDNPHQRKFRGKFFKRQSWQERLLGKA
jgi:iron-sulfur cluster assembly accessory protein